MSNQTTSAEEFFGNTISNYTRKQAIEDGYLIDVSETAKEAGFRWPVAMTRSAWVDCVEWTEHDAQQTSQDESGRLWDVVWMAFVGIRRSRTAATELMFELYRVPRDAVNRKAILTTLKLLTGHGDNGEPVVTIMLPVES